GLRRPRRFAAGVAAAWAAMAGIVVTGTTPTASAARTKPRKVLLMHRLLQCHARRKRAVTGIQCGFSHGIFTLTGIMASRRCMHGQETAGDESTRRGWMLCFPQTAQHGGSRTGRIILTRETRQHRSSPVTDHAPGKPPRLAIPDQRILGIN